MTLERTGAPLRLRPKLVHLGGSQFALLLSALAMIFTVTALAFWLPLYEEFIKAVLIQRFEPAFGFRAGALVVHWPGEGPTRSWGIVSVAAGGEFDRAGVRSGDVPFGRHSGVIELYGSLAVAASGEGTWFEVFNVADVHKSAGALREIWLPAATREKRRQIP